MKAHDYNADAETRRKRHHHSSAFTQPVFNGEVIQDRLTSLCGEHSANKPLNNLNFTTPHLLRLNMVNNEFTTILTSNETRLIWNYETGLPVRWDSAYLHAKLN